MVVLKYVPAAIDPLPAGPASSVATHDEAAEETVDATDTAEVLGVENEIDGTHESINVMETGGAEETDRAAEVVDSAAPGHRHTPSTASATSSVESGISVHGVDVVSVLQAGKHVQILSSRPRS